MVFVKGTVQPLPATQTPGPLEEIAGLGCEWVTAPQVTEGQTLLGT